MQVKRFNISKPKKYKDRDGNEKTQWNNIGMITEFHKEGGQISRIIEIPAIGLEANIFPFEPKTQGNQPADAHADPIREAVDPADLPF